MGRRRGRLYNEVKSFLIFGVKNEGEGLSE
jgi:hypothetical protein